MTFRLFIFEFYLHEGNPFYKYKRIKEFPYNFSAYLLYLTLIDSQEDELLFDDLFQGMISSVFTNFYIQLEKFSVANRELIYKL